MNAMIDMHCHMLPGIDDGSANDTETLELAQGFLEHGFSQVVVTPHIRPGMFNNTESSIRERFAYTQELLNQNKLDLPLFVGTEYYYDDRFLAMVHDEASDLLTFNDAGHYLLVEFDTNVRPLQLRDAVYKLKLRGITPIMAHPERYSFVRDDLEYIESLIDGGMLLQGTLGPLTGLWGGRPRALLKTLLERGMIHLVSTDIHRSRQIGRLFHDGVEGLTKLLGESRTTTLMQENPARILQGDEIL